MLANIFKLATVKAALEIPINDETHQLKPFEYDCTPEEHESAAILWCDHLKQVDLVAQHIGESISGPYEELSQDDIIAMMESMPLEGNDWVQDFEIIVIPLTLDQFWNAFWANDAPYYIPARPRDPEDKLLF